MKGGATMECWNCRRPCKTDYAVRQDERFGTLVVTCPEGTKVLTDTAQVEPVGHHTTGVSERGALGTTLVRQPVLA